MKNETVFIEVFGSNPIIKVLDFLITYRLFDYSLTEITKNSEVSYSTLQRTLTQSFPEIFLNSGTIKPPQN